MNYESQSESTDGTGLDEDDGGAIPGARLLSDAVLGDEGSWTGSAEYYLAWGGADPRYVLFKNFSANNTFFWTNVSPGPAGLSGVDGVGVIPLPAAGWLMLAGLGGLAALRRRKTV